MINILITPEDEWLENIQGELALFLPKENGQISFGTLKKTDYSKPENQQELQPVIMPQGGYFLFG